MLKPLEEIKEESSDESDESDESIRVYSYEKDSDLLGPQQPNAKASSDNFDQLCKDIEIQLGSLPIEEPIAINRRSVGRPRITIKE